MQARIGCTPRCDQLEPGLEADARAFFTADVIFAQLHDSESFIVHCVGFDRSASDLAVGGGGLLGVSMVGSPIGPRTFSKSAAKFSIRLLASSFQPKPRRAARRLEISYILDRCACVPRPSDWGQQYQNCDFAGNHSRCSLRSTFGDQQSARRNRSSAQCAGGLERCFGPARRSPQNPERQIVMTKQGLAIRRQGQGQPVRRELRNVFLQSCLLKWTQQMVPGNHTLLHREYELLQAECGARATPDVIHRSLPLRATIRNLIGSAFRPCSRGAIRSGAAYRAVCQMVGHRCAPLSVARRRALFEL